MVFINLFKLILFLTCLPPVESFWFFSCRHGNGNGDVNDPCWALCQCRAPNTCEAGVQRCVSPGKLNDHCHLTKPCGRGLSCHPGIQKCYHVPRRLYEPCVAGYECGSGLSCQPGIQVCFHALRRYNEPCVGGYPCGPGLSCQPGTQRCLHFPRLENERCSLGFECAAGLDCTLCAQPYLTCQLGRVPDAEQEFYRRPYNKVAFLVTHNSFSNGVQYAVWVRNQRVSVMQQLKDGVRGLMLDIYPGWGKAEVRLCHAVCFWGGSSDLLDTLIQIRHFLETNPREVVTIIFEDYLRNPTILKRVFDQARISSHVLRSDHWGTVYRDWPTLEEMRTLGRLVVFNNNGMEGFPYTVNNMWYYVRENRYGHPGQDTKTCVDRGESQYNAHSNDNWSLVLVNWFGTIPNPLDPCLNSFPKLQEKLLTCQRAFGQLPNFLAVDFYHDGEKGGAFKAVKWLNKQWKAQFPTTNKSFTEKIENKYLQNIKTPILNYWNQIMTGVNETETKEKSMTRNIDHVPNTTNHIRNMTHVVKASNQSAREKIRVVNMTGHVINMTRHVMGNSTKPPVTMEMAVYNKSIIGLENDTDTMDNDDRRSNQKQFKSIFKDVDLSFNNSNSDETTWENGPKLNDNTTNTRVSNISGLDSKLLKYNVTSYKINNKTENEKVPANQSIMGKDFEEGILVDGVLNGTQENSDGSNVLSDTKGPQVDPRMMSNTTTNLLLRKNKNVTQDERSLNRSNVLNANSTTPQGMKIYLNATNFNAVKFDTQMLNTSNSSLNQMASKNKLAKLFDLFSSARNSTTNNTEIINNNETTGIRKGTAETGKPFWNLPRNYNGNKTELLEEIIDDIR